MIIPLRFLIIMIINKILVRYYGYILQILLQIKHHQKELALKRNKKNYKKFYCFVFIILLRNN